MDEHLRQLRRVAHTNNDNSAWQAYCRGLERLCGIEDYQAPVTSTILDAVLIRTSNEIKEKQQAEKLRIEDLRHLTNTVLKKMQDHGVTFFTYQVDLQTGLTLRNLGTTHHADSRWYFIKSEGDESGVKLLDGVWSSQFLRILQLRNVPNNQDLSRLLNNVTDSYVSDDMRAVILQAMLQAPGKDET